MFYCYILRCRDGSLYSGITNNLKLREQRHNAGLGSKYVRSRGGGKIVYFEKYKLQSHALRREAEIKKLPHQKKLEIIKKPRNR